MLVAPQSVKKREFMSKLIKGQSKELSENTVEGESITVNDSAEYPSMIIPMANTYQKTTSIGNEDEYDSPSIDYPSEIEYVKESYNIKKQNKNLFDKNNYTIFGGDFSDGLKLNSSDTRHKWVVMKYSKIGATISIYSNNNSTLTAAWKIVFLSEFPTKSTTAIERTSYTIGVVPEGTKYIMIYLGATFSSDWTSIKEKIASLIVAETDKKLSNSDYVQHEEEIYELNLGDYKLATIGEASDHFNIDYVEDNGYKRITKLEYVEETILINNYNNEEITTEYMSSTGGLNEGSQILYVSENPITTEVTDKTLISQFEALINAFTEYGTTHIDVTNEEENLNPNLKLTYKKSNRIQLENIQNEIDNLKALVLEG